MRAERVGTAVWETSPSCPGERTATRRALTAGELQRVADALAPGNPAEMLADFGNIPVRTSSTPAAPRGAPAAPQQHPGSTPAGRHISSSHSDAQAGAQAGNCRARAPAEEMSPRSARANGTPHNGHVAGLWNYRTHSWSVSPPHPTTHTLISTF